MTVAIGMVCCDGVLVAADSMASDPMTVHTIRKVHALDGCPVVWGAAGSVYVAEEVEIKLDSFTKAHTELQLVPGCLCDPDAIVLRERLKGAILPTMQQCYQGALCATPHPEGAIPSDLKTQFLVLGWVGGKPMFLEFDEIGQVNSHLDTGFYAIGFGGPFASVAQGLMAHYFGEPMPLKQAQLVAYRTISTVCEIAPSAVGPPVRLAVVDGDGARVLGDEELSEIETGVERWKTLEAETLAMGAEDAKKEALGDLPSLGQS